MSYAVINFEKVQPGPLKFIKFCMHDIRNRLHIGDRTIHVDHKNVNIFKI